MLDAISHLSHKFTQNFFFFCMTCLVITFILFSTRITPFLMVHPFSPGLVTMLVCHQHILKYMQVCFWGLYPGPSVFCQFLGHYGTILITIPTMILQLVGQVSPTFLLSDCSGPFAVPQKFTFILSTSTKNPVRILLMGRIDFFRISKNVVYLCIYLGLP